MISLIVVKKLLINCEYKTNAVKIYLLLFNYLKFWKWFLNLWCVFQLTDWVIIPDPAEQRIPKISILICFCFRGDRIKSISTVKYKNARIAYHIVTNSLIQYDCLHMCVYHLWWNKQFNDVMRLLSSCGNECICEFAKKKKKKYLAFTLVMVKNTDK